MPCFVRSPALLCLLSLSLLQATTTTNSSTNEVNPYDLDPDTVSSIDYAVPEEDYSAGIWCHGEQGDLPPARMRVIDRLIQKWQGRRITRLLVAQLKRSLKNPSSRLRQLLGRVGQDPREPDFAEGDAAGDYKVPGKLVQFLIHILGETRTVVGYLWRFGFLPKVLNRANDENYEGAIPPCAVTNAVREFQRFNGLEPNGVLTKETRLLMSKDRCGNPDVQCTSCEDGGREKRYAVRTTAWSSGTDSKVDLTYYFHNYAGSLSEDETRAQVENGMRVWTHDAPITFTETEDPAGADLRITWASQDHEDKYKFDGQGGTLAHAFYPTSGLVHYDDDEVFIAPSDDAAAGAASLLYTTAHEMGHSLGLKHSSETGALMYPVFTEAFNNHTEVVLSQDDIAGVTELYGPGDGGVYPIGSSSATEPAPACNPRFTASFTDPTSSALELNMIFGDRYFVLGTRSASQTSTTGSKLPRARERAHYNVGGSFSGLEGAGPFTAGVTDSATRTTYLFKDGEVCEMPWKGARSKTLSCSDITQHPRFAGLPSSIDGIANAKKSVLIAFSGDKYYLVRKTGVVNTGGHPLPFSDVYLAFNSFYSGYIYVSLRSDPDKYLLLKGGVLSQGTIGCSSTTCSSKAIWGGWSYRNMFTDWHMVREDFQFCDGQL